MTIKKTAIDSRAVKQYAIDAGASVVGIASAADFALAPEGFRPEDALPGCLSVVVPGAASPADALNGIDEYTASRNAMLAHMTDMAKTVAARLKADGCKTKAISASGGKYIEVNGAKEQWGPISLKHAAELAGLGVIGRNYLLTNPQYGSLLWLSAVLTDAPLAPDAKTPPALCADCGECVRACPSGALDNPAAFGKKRCSRFFVIENGKLRIKCFLCRTICPRRFGSAAS